MRDVSPRHRASQGPLSAWQNGLELWKVCFWLEGSGLFSYKIPASFCAEQWSRTARCFEERWWLLHYVSSIPLSLRTPTFLSMNKTWIAAILSRHFLICKSCCSDVCFPSLPPFFPFHFFLQGDTAALEEIKRFIRNEILRVFEGTSSAVTEVLCCGLHR